MADLGVYISSFQPLTNLDLRVIIELSQHCNHMLVLISSSDRPRSVRAPFSLEQRISMVRALELPGHIGITIGTIGDKPGHNGPWTEELETIVNGVLELESHMQGDVSKPLRSVAIATHVYDSPIYKLVRQSWERPCIDTARTAFLEVASTQLLRGELLRGMPVDRADYPKGIGRLIDQWVETDPLFPELIEDYEEIQRLQKKYGIGPFNAVDVIVKKGSKVLTIRRGGRPCRGAIAFPGGLIDPGETPLEAAQRELGEETDIGKVLLGLPVGEPVPFTPTREVERNEQYRDPRYDFMKTTAFLWELPDDGNYPVISGHDDAAAEEDGKPRSTDWRDISALTPDVMWADSGYFLQDLVRP